MNFFGQPNRLVRFTDTEIRLEVARGWGVGRGWPGKWVFHGDRVPVWKVTVMFA